MSLPTLRIRVRIGRFDQGASLSLGDREGRYVDALRAPIGVPMPCRLRSPFRARMFLPFAAVSWHLPCPCVLPGRFPGGSPRGGIGSKWRRGEMVVSFMAFVLHDPDHPEAKSRRPPRRRPARRGHRPEGPGEMVGGFSCRRGASAAAPTAAGFCRHRPLPTPPAAISCRRRSAVRGAGHGAGVLPTPSEAISCRRSHASCRRIVPQGLAVKVSR